MRVSPATSSATELRGIVVLAFTAYLGVIGLAEALLATSEPVAGLAAYALLLLVLPLHAALAGEPARSCALALTIIPVLRICSAALFLLPSLPTVASLALLDALLLTSLAWSARSLGLGFRELGLRLGNPVSQLAIGALGVPLGYLLWYSAAPAPLPGNTAQWVLVVLGSGLIANALAQELAFRGVLHALAL